LLKPEAISWQLKKETITKVTVCLVVLALVLGLYAQVVGGSDTLHDVSTSWQWKGHNLVYYQNSVYGNVSITQRGEQLNFFESGLPVFSVPDPDIAFNEEVVHFPMLYQPSPGKVLLIGGGIAGTLEQVLKHPVDEVHYAELDPLIIEAARDYAPQSFLRALDDSRVSIKDMDGRFLVKNSRETYDVIIVTLPASSTLQLNRLYTRDFFVEVAGILSPTGVFSTVFPASESYLNREMINLNRCLYDSLTEVFDSVLIIPGSQNIFLASPRGQLVGQDTDTLSVRLRDRGLDTKLVTADYIRYKLRPVRTEQLLAPILAARSTPVNRDLRPIGCYYSLALWNTMFHPGAAGFFDWASRMHLWWFTVPVSLLVLIGLGIRFRRRISQPRLMSVVVAIMTTGFAGMTLSIILLLALQTLEGYLYQKLAIIIAAFMLGLAFGGTYMNHIAYKVKREILALAKIEFIIVAYSILVAFILVMIFANLGKLPFFIPAEVLLSILNCAGGFLVGLEFPLASKIYLGSGEPVGRVAGGLYAADLLGGCVGAVLASVFLVPILGIPQTCFVIALINGASLILLLTFSVGEKRAKA